MYLIVDGRIHGTKEKTKSSGLQSFFHFTVTNIDIDYIHIDKIAVDSKIVSKEVKSDTVTKIWIDSSFP